MNPRLAALLLSLAAGASCAQSLPRGASLDYLQATRDQLLGQSIIIGKLTNRGTTPLPAPAIDFALYDRDGKAVGLVSQRAEADLAPGATWEIRSDTPLAFTRFYPIYRGQPVAAPAAKPSASKKPARKPAPKKPAAEAKPAQPPTPKPAAHSTTPSKPALYDWSRRRTPGNAKPKTTPATPAATPVSAPAPAPTPPATPVPVTAPTSPVTPISAPAPAIEPAVAAPEASPPAIEAPAPTLNPPLIPEQAAQPSI